jgi:hypothetical protein
MSRQEQIFKDICSNHALILQSESDLKYVQEDLLHTMILYQEMILQRIVEAKEKLRRASPAPPAKKNRTEMAIIFRYSHESYAMRGSPKHSGSKGAVFLGGNQGSFQPDLYCFSSDSLQELRFSDNPKHVRDYEEKGWTRTAQYFKIDGRDKALDFDFRCCDAHTYSAAKLINDVAKWEEYYNATVRVSKIYLEVLNVDWESWNVVALHAGVAYTAETCHDSSLSMLEYMESKDKIFKQTIDQAKLPFKLTIRTPAVQLMETAAIVTWKVLRTEDEESDCPILVIRVPKGITCIQSVVRCKSAPEPPESRKTRGSGVLRQLDWLHRDW